MKKLILTEEIEEKEKNEILKTINYISLYNGEENIYSYYIFFKFYDNFISKQYQIENKIKNNLVKMVFELITQRILNKEFNEERIENEIQTIFEEVRAIVTKKEKLLILNDLDEKQFIINIIKKNFLQFFDGKKKIMEIINKTNDINLKQTMKKKLDNLNLPKKRKPLWFFLEKQKNIPININQNIIKILKEKKILKISYFLYLTFLSFYIKIKK